MLDNPIDALTKASPEEVSRRFKEIIAAADWEPATAIFDRAFADLVDQAYRAPRLFTYVDLFCGAGGSSIGLTMAGGQLLLAANHSKRAVETHQKNFRRADHECVDLDHYNMRKLPDADVLWASPICTEVSPNAGRQRPRKPTTQAPATQQELFKDEARKYGPVDDEVFERTRATFFDVIRAVEARNYRIVIIENVVEAAIEWKLFWHFLSMLDFLGRDWQILCVSAAHVGDDTNPHAAQRRDRMYIVANRRDVPKPDLTVRPQSWCAECGLVEGVQRWKPKSANGVPTASGKLLPVGKYGPGGQYWYHCPNRSCGRIVAPLERPAASIIDWSNLGTVIEERAQNGERPLVPNTLNRILRGMREHHEPQLAAPTGLLPALPDGMNPIGPWSAFLDANGGNWNTDTAPIGNAFRTRTTKEWEGLATAGLDPLIDTARRNAVPCPARSNPLNTLSTARHSGLVVPYYRTGVAKPANTTPFPTLATKDTCGLATSAPTRRITMDDVMRSRYRMITSEEAARAQRFPRFYEITGNPGECMAQVGNAVATNAAQMIGERVADALNRTAAHV